MRFKEMLLILSVTLFTSCTGWPFSLFTQNPLPPEIPEVPVIEQEESFFTSLPLGNELVFIGAIGRRSNPADTLRLALEDAAKRVSIFYGVYGEYSLENNVGSGAFDYTNNVYSSIQFNEEGASQYIDSLKYDSDTDTIMIDNVFFIRTTYPSTLPYPVNYRPTYNSEGKPDWIERPPYEIDGYEVSVGFSGRRSSMADTYSISRNNAILSIIRSINSVSLGSDLLYDNTGNLFGYKTSSENTIYSFGTLDGFYVLDTWIDNSAKTIWTLAIARKAH